MFPVFFARRLDSIALANIDMISKVQCPVFFVHGTLFVDAGHIESKFLNLFLRSMQEFTVFCAKKAHDNTEKISAQSPYN